MRVPALAGLAWVWLLAAMVTALSYGAPQGSPAPSAIFVDSAGVAIAGYDVVTYFSSSQPRKGVEKWKAQYKGAWFHFVSAANRDRFLANPEQFVPQFGGYCAFSMAHGMVKGCDPRRFSVKDGKLFLFAGAAARDTWKQDDAGWLDKAIAKWREIMGGA